MSLSETAALCSDIYSSSSPLEPLFRGGVIQGAPDGGGEGEGPISHQKKKKKEKPIKSD